MGEERRKILQMLAEGKISADDAERLLKKLDEIDNLGQARGTAESGPESATEADAKSREKKSSASPSDAYDKVHWSGWSDWANSGMDVKFGGTPGTFFGFVTKLIKSSLDTFGMAAHVQSRTERVAHQAGAGLRVRTRNGAVNVTRSALAEVEIRADVRACSPERLASVKIVAVRDALGVLDIRADWPGGGPRLLEGCAFTIAVPDATGVDIETTNGSISIEDLAGEGVLRTRNGGIDVRRHDGNVRSDTTNGRLRLVDIHGNIVAHGSNGRISIERCSGSADAETTNGGIDLVQTPEGLGPVRLTTTNGCIRAELGSAFRGSLRLRTANGQVSFNEPPGLRVLERSRTSADLELGGNALQSSLKTTNGAVQVTLASVEENAAVAGKQ